MPSAVQTATGRFDIDALLAGHRWDGLVTYSFPDSPSDYAAGYGDEPLSGFFAISPYQHVVVDYAFALIESYTNLVFDYIGTVYSDIAFGQTSLADTAYASVDPSSSRGGDVWFGDDFRNPRVGDYAFLTHLHEIGHSMGLVHPHEGEGLSGQPLPLSLDWLGNTVMSYRSALYGPLTYSLPQFHFPTTYMPLDIQALQTMYGADYSTNGGDTVYSWSSATGQQFINGAGQLMPGSGSGYTGDGASNYVFMTVWDGGGTDTFDFSGYGLTASHTLDLNLTPGARSTLPNGMVYNSFVHDGDNRSLVENVIGSVNNDTVTGNDENNRLEGRDGDDNLIGARGNDRLLGGAGNDTMTGGRGNDYMNDSAGYNQLHGSSGTDTAAFDFNFLDAMIRFLPSGQIYVGTVDGFALIDGVETLRFADATIRVADIRPADSSAPLALVTNDNWVVSPPGTVPYEGQGVALQFGEAVTLGSGEVRLYYSDGALVRTFDVEELWTDNDQLFLPYPQAEGQYYVEIDPGVVVDNAGNPFGGLSGPNAWNFFVGVRSDDYPDEIGSGSGQLTVGAPALGGYLANSSDNDTFRISLTGGTTYFIDFEAAGVNAASGAEIQIFDGSGQYMANANAGDPIFFTATYSNTYYFRVVNGAAYGGPDPTAGDYSIRTVVATDDFAGDSSTSGVVASGSSISGTAQGSSDVDWIRVDLVAGQTYRFTVDGVAVPGLGLGEASNIGVYLTRQEDGTSYYNPLPGSFVGAGGYSDLAFAASHDTQLTFTADRTGTYYLVLQPSSNYNSVGISGGYSVDVDQGNFTAPHVVSVSPGSGETAVTPDASIVITFDRPVTAGDGSIFIRSPVYGGIDVHDASQVRIQGNVVTITPTAPLEAGQYNLFFDASAFVGADGTFATLPANGQFTVGYYQSTYFVSSDDYAGDASTFGHIELGGSATGRMHNNGWVETSSGGAFGSGDSDWFRVELVAGENYDINLVFGNGQERPNNYTRDLNLALYTAAGVLVVEDSVNSGGGLNSRIMFDALETGIYYVVVTGGPTFDGQNNNPSYTVELNAPAGITLTGTAAADRLDGTPGNDRLDGGGGADTLSGAGGNDTYVIDNSSDVILELAGGGNDLVISSISYALGATLENLTLSDSAAINGTGNAGNNRITGNSAANLIDGRGGADVMAGGGGDDTYIVDSALDTIIEYSNGGVDLVQSSVSFTLSASVENLTLTGSGAINGTGNSLANVIRGTAAANSLIGGSGNDSLYGYAGNDVFNGGAGIDRLYGGAGNDTYYVVDSGDYAYENAGEGTDSVVSSVTHTLRANIESLTLSGTANISGTGNDLSNRIAANAGANRLFGLSGDDSLYGFAGNDRLDGGAGLDRMYGGLGNDIYTVRDADDYVYENAGEGTDRVYAAITHVLRANVEELSLSGTANINGSGNDIANRIVGNAGANRLYGLDGNDRLYGNAGNDRLDGGTGGDLMYGGVGNDIYYADNASDVAVEVAGAGTDSVYASVSYTLRANVERLYLTGSADLSGKGTSSSNLITGNAGANSLYGYDGNDRLDGGAGDDSLKGGVGNDTLVGGIGSDKLFGEANSDTLYGGDGNDAIEGGSGRDVFYGGAGADSFTFRDGDFSGVTASTADQVRDFSHAEGDLLRLNIVDANTGLSGDQAFAFIGSGAFSGSAGQLRFEQTGGNTYVQGDTNGDGVADFWIRLDGLHNLTAGDFVF